MRSAVRARARRRRSSGNCVALSRPLRVTRRTSRADTSAITRMPSYFCSNVQPWSGRDRGADRRVHRLWRVASGSRLDENENAPAIAGAFSF